MDRDETRMLYEGRKDATTRNRKNRAKKKLRETYGQPHPSSPEARKAAERKAERAKAQVEATTYEHESADE